MRNIETTSPGLKTHEMRSGSVESRDGTRIGYLQLGHGPAVVVLHGSNESARSHSVLANALADSFTVYLPDRRGRGMSGPYGSDYGMKSEVEDLDAVLTRSGADMAFGVSAGGLIVLETARVRPGLRKLALYEPALLLDGDTHLRWVDRYDREMAEGKVAAALITSLRGLDLGPALFRRMPRRLTEALTSMAMKNEEKGATSDSVTMRRLAPTLHYDALLLKEMAGKIDPYRQVSADVLLAGGGKGLAYLKPTLDALEQTLPHCRRVEFPGLDHGASTDPSSTNRGGRPEVVARELLAFFAEPS